MAWRWLEKVYLADDTELKLFVPKTIECSDDVSRNLQLYSNTTEPDLSVYFSQIGDIKRIPLDAPSDNSFVNLDFKDGGRFRYRYQGGILYTYWWYKPGASSYMTMQNITIGNLYDWQNWNFHYGWIVGVNDDTHEAFLRSVFYAQRNNTGDAYDRNHYKLVITNAIETSGTSPYDGNRDHIYNILGIGSQPVPPSPDEFYFYNHSKKVNSTKQPTGGTRIQGHFREPFNLLSPVLHIEASNEFPYNYCKWHDSANNIDRYYWIRNKGWMPNNVVELTLEEDILATFKTSIGATNAFIKRSASNFNPLITDNAWITQNGAEILNQTPIAGSPFDIANGFYVVGIMQKDQGSANSVRIARKGGVDYFACKEAELNDLIGFLADFGATGVWGDYRPIDRVVFLRFFPFNAGTPSSSIYQCTLFQHTPYGQSETEFTWELHQYSGISGEIASGNCSIAFSDHPQVGTDRTYLNYLPYTELAVKAGPFGKIDLSKNLLDKDELTNQIDFTVIADLISGLSVLLVYSGQKLIYYTEDYSCSVDIAISQEFVNRYSDIQQRDFNKLNAQIEKTVTAVAAGAAIGGGILTENPLAIATGLTLAVTAVATEDRGNRQYEIDSYNMAIPQLSCRGTNGTWFKISENWRLITTYHLIAGDSPATLGRPKQDYDLISNCSGYVICNAASFEDSNALVTETIQINDFLNRGFYYE